ncbi:hypothetical protein QR680_017082 [Steinernema hermaphroditum]|uniref:Major facilitator superfamily (MFS) profile domain-containing protein n=1 Tax=Steinernema hermaphroditum TaxID=289476 RepID=A0AA39LNH3_9BILA|nr:hypothetical protein QR680_017082 [Steinernema hermaphroditum]
MSGFIAKLRGKARTIAKKCIKRINMTAAPGSSPSRWVPKATDGGWGWFVVVGSFLIHVFADGIVYSFGVMVDVLMNEFGESNARVSVIVSLLTGLTLGVGPVASAITNKFGCRATTITGALIATVGCALSYFAQSIDHLMITVGCIMGFGFGLMYCPAIVIVTMYFEKKRALATGIAVCGAGFGTLVFAPVIQYLIDRFAWNTVFLFYTGAVFACVGCGALFRPLEFVEVDEHGNEISPNKDVEKTEKVALPNTAKEEEMKTLLKSDAPKRGSGANLTKSNSHSQLNSEADEPSRADSIGSDKSNLLRAQSLGDNLHVSPVRSRSHTMSESAGYLNVKDVFYTGSTANLPEALQDERERFLSVTSLHSHATDGKHPLKTIEEEVEEEEKRNMLTSLWRTISKMTDVTLLWDPVFLLFAVSNLLTSVGFNSPLIFLPKHGIEGLKLEPLKAASVISVFGATNTIGRVVFGLVSDRPLPFKYGKDTARNRLWIYNLSLSICGLFTIFCFLCWDFYSLGVYAGIFGFTLSSYVCLTSVLLVDLLGVDKLTNAFGLLLLFQGVGTVFGPPIAGKLADLTGSYAWTFAFCGISLFISGVMLFAIPFLQKKKTSGDDAKPLSKAAPVLH